MHTKREGFLSFVAESPLPVLTDGRHAFTHKRFAGCADATAHRPAKALRQMGGRPISPHQTRCVPELCGREHNAAIAWHQQAVYCFAQSRQQIGLPHNAAAEHDAFRIKAVNEACEAKGDFLYPAIYKRGDF